MRDPIEVLWQDGGLAVINKPHGLMVHHPQGGDDLLVRLLDQRGWSTAHACHRLDAAAAGALLVAYERECAGPGSQLFAKRAVQKRYLCVCTGIPAFESETVEKSLTQLGRHAVVHEDDGPEDARPALTTFVVIGKGRDAALVLAMAKTGRFHQVRAHLASLGHPLCGDRHYGASHDVCLALHALQLGFTHPRTGKAVLVQAPVQPPFGRLVQRHGILAAAVDKAMERARTWQEP